jgi:hypothetical protein
MKSMIGTLSVLAALGLTWPSLAAAEHTDRPQATENTPDTSQDKPPQLANLGRINRNDALLEDVFVEYPSDGRSEFLRGYDNILIDARTGYRPPETIPVVVIPSPESIEGRPATVETTAKDLNIMCRVFDEQLGLRASLSQDPLTRAAYYMNIGEQSPDIFSTFLRTDNRNTKAICLEGYGAIFMTSVAFPLAAPPKAEEQKEEPEEPVDTIWKRAERELYGPVHIPRSQAAPSSQYDAKKVESLKTNIIKSLKHAANIRNLRPDEWVVVIVNSNEQTGGLPKVLTVRAGKSDIDAFSEGTLSLDQFRPKVQIWMHPGSKRASALERVTDVIAAP